MLHPAKWLASQLTRVIIMIINKLLLILTILNLVFTTHPDLLVALFFAQGMIDHSVVKCNIDLQVPPPTNPPRYVYLYKQANMTGLQEHVS